MRNRHLDRAPCSNGHIGDGGRCLAEVLAINATRVASDRVHYVRNDLFEWDPQQRFDFVFFGFWLSHVPPDQFDLFWSKVQASLKPGGKVFFLDSRRAEESTAANHILPLLGILLRSVSSTTAGNFESSRSSTNRQSSRTGSRWPAGSAMFERLAHTLSWLCPAPSEQR